MNLGGLPGGYKGFFAAYMNPEPYKPYMTSIPSPYNMLDVDGNGGPKARTNAMISRDDPQHPLYGARQTNLENLVKQARAVANDKEVFERLKEALASKKEMIGRMSRGINTDGGNEDGDDDDDTGRTESSSPTNLRNKAATKIQKVWRGGKARMKVGEELFKAYADPAATMIQKHVRGMQERKKLAEKRLKEEIAALKIQRAYLASPVASRTRQRLQVFKEGEIPLTPTGRISKRSEKNIAKSIAELQKQLDKASSSK